MVDQSSRQGPAASHKSIWLSVRQLAADFFQRRPPWLFQRYGARALPLVQILAAVRAQSLAIFATRDLQRDGQQYLLAHHIVEQDPLAFIIADLGFRIRHRYLVPPSIRTLGTIQQVKLAFYVLNNRLQTASAVCFQAGRQGALDAYVLDYLVLAVMLLDQVGPPA